MTGGEIAQIITSIATLTAAVGALVVGWHNSNKITDIKTATNGLTSKLVNLTAVSSEAKGNLAGRAELTQEQAVDQH